MRIGILKSLVFISTIIAIGVTGYLVFPFETEAQDRSQLFTIKKTQGLAGEKNSPGSVRESDIDISLSSVRDSNQISFPLFDGKSYTATRNRSEGFENRGPDSFTWRGKIMQGEFVGDVVLTSHKGFMTGMIYSPEAVYEIVSKGNRQILVQLDQSLFPECGGEIRPPVEANGDNTSSVGVVEDSGDRIDVLVVYTDAVRTAVGGDAQATALAQGAIDISNTAYRNSKVRQRLRLVHTAATALTEANSLSDLRADPATQTLRNERSADMVAMLVNSLSGCGIGYLMTSVNTGFASSAYSITLRTCAVGNLTFAHELGHNMGSTHDPANGGSAAFSYGYGHFVNGNYRSVMSYSSECTSGCTRVPQFSNPAVIYNGVPTGIMDARDNARSIENTADTVANFRFSGTSIKLNNFSQDVFIPRNISKTLSWSTSGFAGNVKIELSRDESSNWETLVANTPNDGSEAISVNGRPTKKVRIRVSSVNDASVSDSSVKNLSIK